MEVHGKNASKHQNKKILGLLIYTDVNQEEVCQDSGNY